MCLSSLGVFSYHKFPQGGVPGAPPYGAQGGARGPRPPPSFPPLILTVLRSSKTFTFWKPLTNCVTCQYLSKMKKKIFLKIFQQTFWFFLKPLMHPYNSTWSWMSIFLVSWPWKIGLGPKLRFRTSSWLRMRSWFLTLAIPSRSLKPISVFSTFVNL